MYPTAVEATPGTWRNLASTPQKHPAPKVAFSIAFPYKKLRVSLKVPSSLYASISPLDDKCKVRSLKKKNSIKPV
jgi:hypothetical protein